VQHEEISDQIQELAFSFQQIYKPRLLDGLAETDQECRDMESRSDVALSTLQSIFPNRPEAEPGYLRGAWGRTSNLSFENIRENL